MRTRFTEFNPTEFSFKKNPVLVLDQFWSSSEMAAFRKAMELSKWTPLAEMPLVAKAFSHCGNWLKADIGPNEAHAFLQRVGLSCIAHHMESFPNIKGRHVNFNYYSYQVGDCLSTHDDTDDAYTSAQGIRPPTRRIALVTYFHQEWQPDWGGELIIYREKKDQQGNRTLEISECIAPTPGSLVLFTVPRFHRVCRVDDLAGEHKRLSIAGWFMTDH